MASEALFQALAEALAKPSKAYRAAQEGLSIPGSAMKGYTEGADFMDKINQRKLAKQTLSEALGGQDLESGIMNMTGETGAIQHPNIASAIALRKTARGQMSPWRVVPGMTTKDNKPVQQNLLSGEVRPVDLPITPTGRGAGFQTTEWDTASESDKALGKAVYEGRIRPSDLSFRDKGVATKLSNEYARVNNLPPAKSYTAEVAGKTASAFAVGKPGMNALSLNTALGHANDALQAYKDVSNTDSRLLNKPLNIIRAQSNDPNIIRLQTTINALSGELAAVFKASSGTDQEIAHWQKVLSQDLTPVQAKGVISQVVPLLGSRLNALEFQRKSGMSGRGEMPLLSPKGAAISERLSGEQEGSGGQDDPMGLFQ